MNKQLRINIGLLGFIILLSLSLRNTEEIKKELPTLSTIEHSDIVQIKILRRDKKNYIFSKQGEAWYMDSPKHFRANKSRINAMLKILNVGSRSQLNPTDVDLESIGLANPTVIMKLNDHEFKFGKTEAIDQYRYVLFENKIHLTTDFLYHQFMTNAAFFADTRLLPKHSKLNAIKFPENKMELIDDQWQLQTLMDIKPDHLNRIAFNWQNATAISVKKYEAPTEESFITLLMEEGKSIELVVLATKPHLIFGRKDLGIQYHMGSDETKKLLLIEDVDINEETDSTVLELH